MYHINILRLSNGKSYISLKCSQTRLLGADLWLIECSLNPLMFITGHMNWIPMIIWLYFTWHYSWHIKDRLVQVSSFLYQGFCISLQQLTHKAASGGFVQCISLFLPHKNGLNFILKLTQNSTGTLNSM